MQGQLILLKLSTELGSIKSQPYISLNKDMVIYPDVISFKWLNFMKTVA